MRRYLAIGIAAAAACPAGAGDVWFVDASAPPWGSGTSWASAFQNVRDALTNDGLAAGDEIRVAAGTYFPDRIALNAPNGNDDQGESFELVDGVRLLGGFPPGGGTPAERDPQAHPTVLSGNIYELVYPPSEGCAAVPPGASDCFQDTPGLPACFNFGCCTLVCDIMPLCCLVSWNENCAEAAESVCPFSHSLHVVSAANVGPGARLDGFVVRDGWAGGQPDYYNPYADYGAGLLVYNSANPVIANCTFEDNVANQGGGLAVTPGCNPLIVNCRFIGNTGGAGGAAYMLQGSATFVNCFILSNTAETGSGGGVYASGGNATLVNCLLFDNLAAGHGAATYEVPVLRNCIVWSSGASPVDSATAVTSSCIEGGHPGEGNISDWPLFADPLHDNFRLRAGSPCIDAGVGTLPADLGDLDGDLDLAEATPRDLGGGVRVLAGAVDIGPYEHCAYDLDADGGVGSADMLALLGAWSSAGDSPLDLDQDGVVGVGDLLALLQHWYDCG